jgi:hypothetical protein
MYVNMHDLSQMAKEKKQRQSEMDLPPPPPELMGSANKVRSNLSPIHCSPISLYRLLD